MRAERLLTILNMMQTRGRVTAPQVARDLEVSERTARRDLDSLITAGFPVVTWRGRNGGWELIGDGTTDLSGLTHPEVTELFATIGAEHAAGATLAGTLAKLLRALPETQRVAADRASRAVVVEQRRAPTVEPPADAVHALRAAIVERRHASFDYAPRSGEHGRRHVVPLGLVSTARAWYLLAETERGRRTYRVDRMGEVVLGQPVEAWPEDFSAAQTWAAVQDEWNERRGAWTTVEVHGRAHVSIVDALRWMAHDNVTFAPGEAAEWVTFCVRGGTVQRAVAPCVCFGDLIEITAPREARDFLAGLGALLFEHYARTPSAATGTALRRKAPRPRPPVSSTVRAHG